MTFPDPGRLEEDAAAAEADVTGMMLLADGGIRSRRSKSKAPESRATATLDPQTRIPVTPSSPKPSEN